VVAGRVQDSVRRLIANDSGEPGRNTAAAAPVSPSIPAGADRVEKKTTGSAGLLAIMVTGYPFENKHF
jgi:hypothetical protein